MGDDRSFFVLEHRDEVQWRGIIDSFPSAHIFHTWEWAAVFADAYGHRPYLVCEGTPTDVVSFIPVSCVPRPFGRSPVVSMPYSDFAGPVSRGGSSDGLLPRLPALVGSRSVEIRSESDVIGEGEETEFCTFRFDLPGTEEEMLKLLPSKSVRYPIRKATRDGLSVRPADAADIPAFHRLVNLTRRRHGLPTPPLKFYRAVHRHLLDTGLGSLLLAENSDGKTVAGSLFLWHGDKAYYKYSAGDPALSPGNAGHLLLWEGVREAIRRGIVQIDLGRISRDNTGLAGFKKHWGGVPMPLHYFIVRADGSMTSLPVGGPGGLHLVKGLFRTLPPILSRVAGDLIYRYFS